MRILHVTDVYLPRCGGIELHVRDLVTEQARRGDEASVATATPGRTTPDPPHVHRMTGSGLRAFIAAGGFDAVHVHVSVWSPFALVGVRAATSLGVPTVVTVHSVWSGLGPLAQVASSALALRALPVVWSAVSESAAEPVRRLLGAGRRVHVVSNAIDPASWTTVPTEPEAPTVLSVMRLTRRKRAIPLVRILEQVRELVPPSTPVRAVVIGDGPQHARVLDELRRRGLDEWVNLAGRRDRAEIREHLARTSVFLAPATRESFGIAALEARAAGVPVVASTHGGVGEFVTHGREGLLAADDDGLGRAVASLIVDPVSRARIAAHNRATTPSCTWDVACAASQRLYLAAAVVDHGARTRTRTVARQWATR